jgi:SAM-dependent methyltransferase
MKYLISFIIRKIPRKYLQLFSHFFLKILSLFYLGNNVKCPVCQHSFRKFLPYGRTPRTNALCPECLALERHRLMWLFLKGKTDFFNESLKLLHIAPELCFIDRFKALNNIDYISADLESPLAMVKMDIHKIPFEENQFDIAFCNHVMEHVEDDIKAMSEIYRVLKPGGWAIIQSPIDLNLEKTIEGNHLKTAKEREKAFGQDDHVRMYGRDYKLRLQEAGFKVIEINLVEEMEEELIIKYALPRDEIIFLCEKI